MAERCIANKKVSGSLAQLALMCGLPGIVQAISGLGLKRTHKLEHVGSKAICRVHIQQRFVCGEG